MDLFTPVVDKEKWHPHFAALQTKHYADTRDVLTDWASDFPDRDGKFVVEYQTTFNSSFWELYLHAAFRDMRIPVDYSAPRPDFSLKTDYGRVYVEAGTTNNPVSGIPESESLAAFREGKIHPEPEIVEKASIRLVNTISSKHKKYLASYSRLPGIAGTPFVLAVAPFEQPHFFSQNTEAIHRVLYGFRAKPRIVDDRIEPIIIRETSMPNENGAPISLGLFANDGMKEISAVIFSSTATMAKVRAISKDSGHVLFGVLRYRKHASTPSYEVKQKHEYTESILDGMNVFHNPFALHELDSRTFHYRGVAQHWFDPRSGLPSDNAEDGSLIQRFCFKIGVREANNEIQSTK